MLSIKELQSSPDWVGSEGKSYRDVGEERCVGERLVMRWGGGSEREKIHEMKRMKNHIREKCSQRGYLQSVSHCNNAYMRNIVIFIICRYAFARLTFVNLTEFHYPPAYLRISFNALANAIAREAHSACAKNSEE